VASSKPKIAMVSTLNWMQSWRHMAQPGNDSSWMKLNSSEFRTNCDCLHLTNFSSERIVMTEASSSRSNRTPPPVDLPRPVTPEQEEREECAASPSLPHQLGESFGDHSNASCIYPNKAGFFQNRSRKRYVRNASHSMSGVFLHHPHMPG
jgi:hypothetical protein